MEQKVLLLGLKMPVFAPEEIPEKVFQAVLPARAEIPDSLQLTVAQVLEALRTVPANKNDH